MKSSVSRKESHKVHPNRKTKSTSQFCILKAIFYFWGRNKLKRGKREQEINRTNEKRFLAVFFFVRMTFCLRIAIWTVAEYLEHRNRTCNSINKVEWSRNYNNNNNNVVTLLLNKHCLFPTAMCNDSLKLNANMRDFWFLFHFKMYRWLN